MPPLRRSVTEDLPWWQARRDRYRRRARSSERLIRRARIAAGLPATGEGWVRPERIARCSWRAADAVGLHHELGQPAHYSGVERCGSVSSCPVCSAVIRHERSRVIQAAVDAWQAEGGDVVMVTVTLRHKASDALVQVLEHAMTAWRALTQRRPWRRVKAAAGIAGTCRALEVTWSGVNGWHPHLHVLLFVSPVEPEEREEFPGWLQAQVYDIWSAELARLGARTISRLHGVRVTWALNGGAYIAKIQEHDQVSRAGLEMARTDMKRGRAGSMVPFEFLDHGDHYLEQWYEYVDALHGRRVIEWSRGFLAKLGQADRSDAEIIADAEALDLVGMITGAEYDSLRRQPAELAKLLEIVEASRQEVLTVNEP